MQGGPELSNASGRSPLAKCNRVWPRPPFSSAAGHVPPVRGLKLEGKLVPLRPASGLGDLRAAPRAAEDHLRRRRPGSAPAAAGSSAGRELGRAAGARGAHGGAAPRRLRAPGRGRAQWSGRRAGRPRPAGPQVRRRPERSRLEQEAGGARLAGGAERSAPPGLSLAGSLLPGWPPAAFGERPEPLPATGGAPPPGAAPTSAPRPHHCLRAERKVGAARARPPPARPPGGWRARGAAGRRDGR